jgi:hypothetical protein
MNQDQPRTADVMALGSFSEITLLQNEHNNLHPQFLANNEYSANVPREERVILSDYLLDLIRRSREGYSYDVYGEDGNKIRKTKRRQTMNFEVHRQLTAQEAHEIRKSGKQRVFPEKISAATSQELEASQQKTTVRK